MATNPKHNAIVVSGDEAVRTAARAAAGFNASFANDATEAIRLADRYGAAVMLLDMELPGANTLATLRVLGEKIRTKALRVVLVCSRVVDRETLQKCVAAGAVGAVVKPVDPAVLQEKMNAAAAGLVARPAASTSVAATPAAAPAGDGQVATRVEANNSLLSRVIACPFHDTPQTFVHFTLRSGRVRTETDVFDIPQYVEPLRGADFCDFNLLAIAVCPKCLFASNNGDYFARPNEPKHKPHEFDDAARAAIERTAPQRLQVCGGKPLGETFFTHDRGRADAILSYRLAIICSDALFESNKLIMPMELLRSANHHIRVAQMISQTDPSANVRPEFEAAFKKLEHAYRVLEGPAFFKTAYQLSVVAIYLGEDKVAMQYINGMRDLERDGDLSPEHRQALSTYHARARKAWEDRDMIRPGGSAAAAA